MTAPEATPATVPVNPVRYGSRYGCALCQAAVPSTRARYCSDACRQRAYRLRQPGPALADDQRARAPKPRQRGDLVAQRVYECPGCDQRFLGERRCPDCNLFCRGLGLGGHCPHCDDLVLVSELLDPIGGAG
jgi:hypothetical protein